jgi:hypothetical protein
MSSDGGKGSSRRPSSVPDAVIADNWARTFAKNPDNTGISKNEYYDILTTEQALQAMVDENERLGLYDDYNKLTRNNTETQAVYNQELDKATKYN